MEWEEPSDIVKLDSIRGALIRQEETIIFALLERAQYGMNSKCYEKGESGILRERMHVESKMAQQMHLDTMSFMEYFLLETESLHAKLGRYNSPDENAFFLPLLPTSRVSGQHSRSPLKPNNININEEVLRVYVNNFLPDLCTDEDDGEYGSTCALDINVLQALSKRIHYGKFVAEAKFQAERERFSDMIRRNDADAIMDALTNIQVEDAVVERVRTKASRYGTDGISASNAYKVSPDKIAKLYREYLIPLNKNVQVQYLLQRLNRPSFSFKTDDFVEKAAATQFSGKGLKCETVEDVFHAVSRNQVGFGVVLIEDSKEGLSKSTQLCLTSTNLTVCGSIKHFTSPNDSQHYRRYYIISAMNSMKHESKTHLVVMFSVKDYPGALLSVLNSLGDVNLCALESIHHEADVSFFCEIEAKSLSETQVTEIVKRLEKETKAVRFVGAY